MVDCLVFCEKLLFCKIVETAAFKDRVALPSVIVQCILFSNEIRQPLLRLFIAALAFHFSIRDRGLRIIGSQIRRVSQLFKFIPVIIDGRTKSF